MWWPGTESNRRHCDFQSHALPTEPFGTEAGLYQEMLGTPAIVCGPGDIAVAHKPDEHVSEEQLAACDRMLEKLLVRLAA